MGTLMTSAESVRLHTQAAIPVLSIDTTEPEQIQNCWETVLLVEDEVFVRDVTQEVLEMCGYTVLTACDAADAIRRFEHHKGPVHLLITDVVMPGMNGRELAGRLLLRCPDLKTIFISGYADNTVLREGAGITSAAYLQKPFTLEALTRKVREVIDSRMRPSTSSAH